MKKISIFAFVITLSVLFTFSTGFACTTILIGKKATVDGAVIHAHNEDMGFNSVGRLWPVQAETHKKKETLKVPYVQIPQPKKTLQYWASGNAFGSTGLGVAAESRPYDAVLVGMNEAGVTMSCNWMYSKEENYPGQGIRRYAMRQLILERSQTARDAVKLIADFIEQYGQADWGGLDYCLADQNEAWVVETTSKHWVAKRVKDNEILVVANWFVIGEKYDLASKDLIDYAVSKGWYNAKRNGAFNFRDAYGQSDRKNNAYDIDRENRAYELLKDKKGVITPEDLFFVLMDRYEGTSKFRKPLSEIEPWENVTDNLLIPRPIGTNICQSSSVAHLRSNLPAEIGAVMWYAMATPGYSGYFPVYAGADTIPTEFQNVSSSYSQDSAWWTFRLLQKIADTDYNFLYPRLRTSWEANHGSILVQQKTVEAKAKSLFDAGKKKEGIDLISRFTSSQAKSALQHARFMLHNIQQLTGNISIW